jgi:hypothetical protein
VTTNPQPQKLPAPDYVDAENTAYWGDVDGGGFVSARPPVVGPELPGGVDLSGVELGGLLRCIKMDSARARKVAGWLLAAANHNDNREN